MGTKLIVDGMLRGMGCQAECLLMITASDSPNTLRPIYTRCAIIDAPEWLPDGYYEVTFSGQSAFLQRTGGCWGTGIPWRQAQEPESRVA